MARNPEVRARIDPEIKKEAIGVLAALSLTVSDVIRLMLTREKMLSFVLQVPNADTREPQQEARRGPPPAFDAIEAVMAKLRAGD